MPFCSKCGTEVPANINFCSKCGNKLQNEQKTTPATQEAKPIATNGPALYNPVYAAWWGIFAIVFPAIIHYLNWKKLKLNDYELEKKEKITLIACIVLGAINFFWNFSYVFSTFHTTSPFIALFMWIIPLICWYFIFGVEQKKYISEKYGLAYNKKPLRIPVIIMIATVFITTTAMQITDNLTLSEAEKREIEMKAIEVVKRSSIQVCPQRTIEEMVNSYMSDSKWEWIFGDNGEDYVRISGGIAFRNQPANAHLILGVKNIEPTEFLFLEIDGIAQNKMMLNALLQEMCKPRPNFSNYQKENDDRRGVLKMLVDKGKSEPSDNSSPVKAVKPPSAREIDMGSGDGSRSKAEIMQVMNARMFGLRNIYNRYLKEKPGFSGKVTLKFTIAPEGDIVDISIVSSTTGYSDFDNTVKNMVSTWKWKAIKSGNTTATIPFTFAE